MKILIVDNLVLFREGLISILKRVEGFTIAGEAQKSQEAVQLARKLQPDLVLIDYYLPDGEGVEAIKTIRRDNPNIKCVILTEKESEDTLIASIRAGAIGYILKDTPASRLITTLRAIDRGEAAFSRGMTMKVVEELYRLNSIGGGQGSKLPALTDRETEVLAYLKKEFTNKEIADAMVISVNTVKVHVHNILKKLKVANRRQAAEIIRRYGL